MAHSSKNKEKLLKRINRLKGQLTSASEKIESGEDCYKVLQLLASCKGALNGLMGELVEGHIEDHIVKADSKPRAAQGAKELNEILKSYWK